MSYDAALSDPLDRVRFAVGDTGSLLPEVLPDDTYIALLTTYNGDEQRVAAAAASTLLLNLPDRIVDQGTTVDLSGLLARLRGLVAAQPLPAPNAAQAFRTRAPVRSDRGRNGSEYRREDGGDW